MAAPSVEELNELFAPGGKPLEQDVVAELQSIARLHQLSAQDLFFKWESYCIKMELEGNQLSLDTVRALKQDIQSALERSNRAQSARHLKGGDKRTVATPRAAKGGDADVFGMVDGLSTPATGKLNKGSSLRKRALETPSISRAKAQPLSSSPMRGDDASGTQPPSFNERQNPGEVIEILNEHLKAAEPPLAPYGEPRIKLSAVSDQKKLNYKTLAMKLSEASEILDDRIDEFMTLLQDQTGLEYSAFGSAAHQSTTEVIAVGRICSDAAEGKLNAASVLLESSRRMGSGLRAPLNLSKLNGAYSFFPGQIVALRGINSSGKEFVVSEVLDLPLLPSAASTPDALAAHRERLRGGGRSMDIDSDTDPAPLNILVAAGPYTADDNLDFEPLHQLCSVAADTLADVLVLCGPFIDAEHPLIATGDFDLPDEAAAAIAASADPEAVTMATVFKYLVAPAINSVAAANPHVTILVVPSVRDAVARHVAWPQEPFSRKEVGLAPRVAHVVGNPMTLLVNEAVVGVSTQDVLFELRHEELVGSAAAFRSDLLARLSRYIIDQRHYFPLFPPVDRSKLPKTGVQDGGGIPPGAMLDTSYLKLGEMLNTRPDVLILPSSLPPFVKVVESVLVINPGYLSKRRAAGTYARMTLHPPTVSERELQSGDMLGHKVFERARVEITRI